MINVNINDQSLEGLKEDGFDLKHGENILTIHNRNQKALVNIVYVEETNNIILMSKDEAIWCKRVNNVLSVNDVSLVIDYEVLQYPDLKRRSMRISNW